MYVTSVSWTLSSRYGNSLSLSLSLFSLFCHTYSTTISLTTLTLYPNFHPNFTHLSHNSHSTLTQLSLTQTLLSINSHPTLTHTDISPILHLEQQILIIEQLISLLWEQRSNVTCFLLSSIDEAKTAIASLYVQWFPSHMFVKALFQSDADEILFMFLLIHYFLSVSM